MNAFFIVSSSKVMGQFIDTTADPSDIISIPYSAGI